MRYYIAPIHKDADSDYGVSFPDLPDVISAGSTLDEAREMAAEALALHLRGLAEDDEAVPEPSSLGHGQCREHGWRCRLDPGPSGRGKERPREHHPARDVLSEIDRRAEQQGFTRSGFLAQAVKQALAA
ncbi:type II toxin-antitoxin system HicB family antitoxin [Bradyrhizobium yuanmingense]|uniref:type II toxin-antitoxin system HicB family antitoxin n=1 Tax=Bradyrhizobium yuanmingense TaxID=108015 RepID=UPI0023B89910|nr:type II toxin-antitoxin system HicB family antitoxin [Bradyrhizobium yuanmingense]MDF0498389.1 type II toxin-antitoxin system HicB family antitoxin [Bradyrhizobium yuanmingense]